MKKIKSFIRRRWATLFVLLCIITASSVIVSAEYIKDKNRAKRVIANVGTVGKRFSSDRLSSAASPIPYAIPFSSEGNSSCEIEFSIFNYGAAGKYYFYPQPIYFEIKAKLVKKDGTAIESSSFETSSYGIKESSGSYTYFSTYNEVLSKTGYFAGTAGDSSHKYVICLPHSMVTEPEKVYIELTATPYSDNSHTSRIAELDILTARLSVSRQTDIVVSQGWTGAFQETNDDLDGFNFAFTGNGNAKLVFCYQNKRFEVNKFFLDEHASETTKYHFEDGYYYSYDETTQAWTKYTDADWNTIIIDAGPGDSRFDIQLYMNNTDKTMYQNDQLKVDWTKINSYIKYNADAPTTAVSGD